MSSQPPFTFPPSLDPYNISRTDLETLIKDSPSNPSLANSTHTLNADISNVAIGAFIFHPNPSPSAPAKLLLLRRSQHERAFPGKWEVPGGGSEYTDPTILHSVVREVFEETGLNVSNIKGFVDYVEFTGSKPNLRNWRKYNFVVEVQDGQEVKTDEREHDAYKWATEEEVREGLKDGGWMNAMDAQVGSIFKAFEEYEGEKIEEEGLKVTI